MVPVLLSHRPDVAGGPADQAAAQAARQGTSRAMMSDADMSYEMLHGEAVGILTPMQRKLWKEHLRNMSEEEMAPNDRRRLRISRANKGRQPWNKGRKHSPGGSLWGALGGFRG